MKIFKNKKRKYIIISGLVSAFAIIGLCITYYNSIPKEEPLIGAYINGTYSEILPTKGSGYAVDKIVCDNNKNASWDYGKWGIKLSNWGTRSRCNIYFKSLESFTLADKKFYLDEMGRCPTMNSDGTVTVTRAEDTYGYLCRAKDVYGDSYYYRGNVTNNYVLFAGKYWRIIRYNGDGTVRVIYDGTVAHANNDASVDRQIGTTSFNYYWKKDNVKESANSYVLNDNAGFGYMYGNRDGIVEQSTQYSTSSYTNTSTYYIAKEYSYNASTDKFTLKNPIAVLGNSMTSDYIGYYTFNGTSSSTSNQYIYKITSVTAGSSRATIGYSYVTYGTTSKDKAQTNTNSSDIKTYLDTWYENNIKGITNEQYVKDNLFCNDRSLSSNMLSGWSTKGYGTEETSYRWHNFAYSSYNNKMMLTCPQKNDAFTVSDTSKGNGALTYGIGLVTADEVVLAGGWNSNNSNYYLYSGQTYWTMSSDSFDYNSAQEYIVLSTGFAGSMDGISNRVGNRLGARPVLNLSSEILNNGNGTASEPFHA